MCSSPHFRESTTKEIHLPEDDTKTISALLEFLYSGDWNYYGWENVETIKVEAGKLDKARKILYHWVEMYVIADKYQLTSLKDAVALKFKILSTGVLPLSRTLHTKEMIKTMKHLYSRVPHVDPSLREFFRKEMTLYNWYEGSWSNLDLDGAMEEGGAFTADLAKGLLQGTVKVESYGWGSRPSATEDIW